MCVFKLEAVPSFFIYICFICCYNASTFLIAFLGGSGAGGGLVIAASCMRCLKIRPIYFSCSSVLQILLELFENVWTKEIFCRPDENGIYYVMLNLLLRIGTRSTISRCHRGTLQVFLLCFKIKLYNL